MGHFLLSLLFRTLLSQSVSKQDRVSIIVCAQAFTWQKHTLRFSVCLTDRVGAWTQIHRALVKLLLFGGQGSLPSEPARYAFTCHILFNTVRARSDSSTTVVD